MYHKRPFLSTALILNNDMSRFPDSFSYKPEPPQKSRGKAENAGFVVDFSRGI